MRPRALHARVTPRLARALGLGLLGASALCACGPLDNAREPGSVLLVLRSVRSGAALPPIDARSIAADATPDGRARFRLPRASLPRTIALPGFCPAEVPPAAPGAAARVDVALAPLFEIPEVAPVGHDAPFRIEITPGCREALAGSIEWSVEAGAGGLRAPVTLVPERRGFVVSGRTPPLESRDTPRWGIVPISARASGEVVLRARWSRPGASGALDRSVRVLGAARATGLPSVPSGAGVLLRGGPFVVRERPAGSRAEVSAAGADLAHLAPDAPGRWVLEDTRVGRTLSLRVGEHAATPLDCGRSDCHARETELALESPMTGALARHVAEPCATACHATSEPGIADGGFAHLARELGWAPPSEPPVEPLEALPRALRRLAGVGCTACHGPGAIPEDGARWAILRSDVCATCHDAPPRYGHVAAWASSAMSRSDASEGTTEAGCAPCHTTAGFLASIGARAETAVPGDAGPLGIACAACHAPHASERLARALVRRVAPPSVLGALPAEWAGSTSSVCLSCHAPRAAAADAMASSAALLLGRAGVRVPGGDALVLAGADAAPHASVVCLDCHGAQPGEATLERGGAHAFAVDPARCARCHADDDASGEAGTPWAAMRAALEARAAALAARLGLGAHADARPTADAASARGRAAYDVQLVVSDPGAWAHAPGYASALLDEAEHALY